MGYGPQSKQGEKFAYYSHPISEWCEDSPQHVAILLLDVEDNTQVQYLNGFKYVFRYCYPINLA